jgi:hypothetical protein
MANQDMRRTVQPSPATLRIPQQVAPIDRAAMPAGIQNNTSGVAANFLTNIEALLDAVKRAHGF